MKYSFLRAMVVTAVVAGLAGGSFPALAVTPTVSLYATGSGDSVQITVYGDAYASVYLFYQQSGYYGNQSRYLGATNGGGYFSTTVSSSTYGIPAGSSVYVTVNNQQSSSVTWPSGSGYGSIYLSQSSVTATVGQSVNIIISGGQTPYSMSSSYGNIFQAAIAGNTLTIIPLAIGSGTLSVCSYGNTGCATLSVTVTSYSPTPYPTYTPYPTPYPTYPPSITPVTFSQSSLSLTAGQQSTVYVYGGTGSFSVAYNSNSNAVQATISGSTLTVSGTNPAAAAIVVCSSNQACGAINVTVSGGYNQGNWYTCAGENQFCSFSGTQTVRYGANGYYYYRTFTNGVWCTNATFGDPIFGTVKQCAIGGTIYY